MQVYTGHCFTPQIIHLPGVEHWSLASDSEPIRLLKIPSSPSFYANTVTYRSEQVQTGTARSVLLCSIQFPFYIIVFWSASFTLNPPSVRCLTCRDPLFCSAMLCYAMLCYAMLCYAMLCYAMLCYAMLCYAMLCYVMLCYAMLCYVMLCYAMLCSVLSCFVLLYCVLVDIGTHCAPSSRPQCPPLPCIHYSILLGPAKTELFCLTLVSLHNHAT